MKIALFGGSFDPIHRGHVALIEAFAKRLQLDKVIVMPSFVPPHKLRSGMAPAEHRLAMCRLATESLAYCEVSDLEIRRGGASFTVDTVASLKETYPNAELFLVTGADMFLTLATWYRFDLLAKQVVFCTAPRDDADVSVLNDYAERLKQQGAVCVVEDIPVIDISSTEIRKALSSGNDIAAFVPETVAHYIKEQGVYATVAKTVPTEEQLREILEKRLTPQRFRHSLAVADEAVRLAEKYGADPEKARIAGLLHDITKNNSPETQLQMMQEFGIIPDAVEAKLPSLWHAITGAGFVEHILDIKDFELLSAIRFHTTAKAGMSLLEKVLYLADFTSADRDYEDVDVMRRLVENSMEEAMEYALRYTITDLVEHHRAVHPDTVAAYNEIVCNRLEA